MFGAIVLLLCVGKMGTQLSLPPHTLTIVQLVLGIGVGVMVPNDLTAVSLPAMMFVGLVTCMLGQVAVSYLWLHKKKSNGRRQTVC